MDIPSFSVTAVVIHPIKHIQWRPRVNNANPTVLAPTKHGKHSDCSYIWLNSNTESLLITGVTVAGVFERKTGILNSEWQFGLRREIIQVYESKTYWAKVIKNFDFSRHGIFFRFTWTELLHLLWCIVTVTLPWIDHCCLGNFGAD